MSARGGNAAERTVQLDVTVLGREFKVGCKESERVELMDAVAMLDQRMRDIRDGGKIAAVDRIAVMAALNLANELLRERKSPPAAQAASTAATVVTATASVPAGVVDDVAARRRIQSMQGAIDLVLASQEKLL